MSEKYEPSKIEDSFYKIWEDRGYFEIDGNRSIQEPNKNFAIMMPPPNVTGSLHIGHALTFTLQDIITRYKRMDGYKTLWQPGTDHAGIATQNVVEKQLLKEGTTKEALGREKFLERVWKWKEFSGGTIVHQMRKLGVSPAWSRERFTMDEGLKEAVKEAFVKLYDEGMITQNNYMVNWCTHDGALSDIEVEHEEVNGKFYHMNYHFADGSGFVTVATTRPETYFGDTAIMVHPDDERYIKEYTSGAFGSQYSLLSSHGSSIHDSLGFGGTLKVRSTDKKILSYVEVIHEKNSLKSGKKPSFSSLFWLRYENSGKITVSDIKDMGGMDMVFKLLNTEEKDKQPKKIVKICNNIQSVKNYEKVATSLKEFNKKNASCKFICGELVTSNKDSIEIKKGVIEYIKNKLKDKNLKTEIIQKYQSLLKDLQGDLNVEQCNRPYNLSVMTIDNLQRNKNDDDMSNIFDKLKNTRSNRLTATLVMKILNEMNLEALKLLYELNLPIYDNKFENCFVQFKDNINDLEVLKDNNNNITDYYNKFCAMIESVNIIDIVDGLSFNNDDSLYQLNYGTPDYQPPKSFLLQEKKKNQKNHNSKPKDMFLLRSLYPVIKQGMMLAYDKQKYFENLIELDKNKKYFGDINAEILIKYFSDENSDEALLKLPVFNQLNV